MSWTLVIIGVGLWVMLNLISQDRARRINETHRRMALQARLAAEEVRKNAQEKVISVR